MCKGPEESELVASFEKLQEIWYIWKTEFKVKILEEEQKMQNLGNCLDSS